MDGVVSQSPNATPIVMKFSFSFSMDWLVKSKLGIGPESYIGSDIGRFVPYCYIK